MYTFYKTANKSQAQGSRDYWYFTDNSSEAELTIYITTNKSEADWIVYLY